MKGPISVSTTAEFRAALATGHTAEEISIAEPDLTKVRADAVTAERKRIADIHAATQRGFEKQAQAAIESGKSPGDFAIEQSRAIKDRGVSLAGIAGDSPRPAPFAAAPEGGGSAWDKIVERVSPQRSSEK